MTTRAATKTTRNKVTEFSSGPLTASMREISKRTSDMVSALWSGRMALTIKGSGQKVFNAEKVDCRCQMGLSKLEYLKTTSSWRNTPQKFPHLPLKSWAKAIHQNCWQSNMSQWLNPWTQKDMILWWNGYMQRNFNKLSRLIIDQAVVWVAPNRLI